MARIFISYRRGAAAGYAGRLSDELERRFGAHEVFRDVEDITSGEDFVDQLERALRDCRVLLAVIDRTWLTAGSGGARRLDDPRDFVRAEVARALKAGVRVIPVLVDGAAMPEERDLPGDLKTLARRQAHQLSDSRWDHDVARLAAVLETDLSAGREPWSSGPPKRWLLFMVLGIVLACAAAVAWHRYDRVPDIDGTWDLPDGSYWVIRQAGRDVTIDVVHYQTREVWQRGGGRLTGNQLAFQLHLVYQQGHTVAGELSLGGDGRRLAGTAGNPSSDARSELILMRR